MKPSLFAAAFLFNDEKNGPSGTASPQQPSPARAEYLAHACRDDPALKFRLADRSAFLERVCRDDPDLRSRVEALLAAHMAAEAFLESSPNANAVETSKKSGSA